MEIISVRCKTKRQSCRTSDDEWMSEQSKCTFLWVSVNQAHFVNSAYITTALPGILDFVASENGNQFFFSLRPLTFIGYIRTSTQMTWNNSWRRVYLRHQPNQSTFMFAVDMWWWNGASLIVRSNGDKLNSTCCWANKFVLFNSSFSIHLCIAGVLLFFVSKHFSSFFFRGIPIVACEWCSVVHVPQMPLTLNSHAK